MIFASAAFLLGTGIAFAQHPKMAGDLDRVDANSTVDVIVQFNGPSNEARNQRYSNEAAGSKQSWAR